MKILVVDDDLEVLNAVGRIFVTMVDGYTVLTATTANAGLNMLKREQPEIIILDVRLGPLSGMDLLKDFNDYLRTHRMDKKPRIIVITAYPDEAVKKEAFERYHVDAFLAKPFKAETIKHEVAKAVIKILEAEKKKAEMLLSSQEQNQDTEIGGQQDPPAKDSQRN